MIFDPVVICWILFFRIIAGNPCLDSRVDAALHGRSEVLVPRGRTGSAATNVRA